MNSSILKRVFFICYFVILIFMPFGLSAEENTQSVSEQFEYEKFLTENILNALSGIAPKGSYMVQVQVEVAEKVEKQSPKDKILMEKMPITKLGIWANPQSFIDAHLNELQMKELPKKSFRSLITKVRVDISLDDKLKPEVDEQVKKVAQAVIKGFLNKPTNVSIARLRMVEELPKEEEKGSFLSRNQILISLSLLGLILLALGLYATSQFYDLGVKQLEKTPAPVSFAPFTGAMPPMPPPAPAAEEAKKPKDDGELDLEALGLGGDDELGGLGEDDDIVRKAKKTLETANVVPIPQGVDRGGEQFKLLIAADPKRAGHLIKQWISANTPDTNEALAVIPRLLSLEVLNPIFQHLDDNSRMRWKEIISEPVRPGAYERADQVLLVQTINTAILPEAPLGEEIQEALVTLTPEDCLKLITDKPQLGPFLAHTLSSLQVSKLFSLLPKENFSALMYDALSFDLATNLHLKEELNEAFKVFKTRSGLKNFNFAATAIDMIHELGPDLEGEVYSAIIKTKDKYLLKKAGTKFFPVQLIHKLPEEIFREILSERPLAERIEIIYIASGSIKDTIRSLVASSDKMGEMLDFQLMQIEADENLKKRLDKNKPKIWRQFVVTIRAKIHGTEFVAEAAESILDKWIAEVTADDYQDPNLTVLENAEDKNAS
jgi:hypothetical protein